MSYQLSILKSIHNLYNFFSKYNNDAELIKESMGFNDYDRIIGEDLVYAYSYIINEAINLLAGKKISYELKPEEVESIEEKYLDFLGVLAKYIEEYQEYDLNSLYPIITELYTIKESHELEPRTLEILKEQIKSSAKQIKRIIEQSNITNYIDNPKDINEIKKEVKALTLSNLMLEFFVPGNSDTAQTFIKALDNSIKKLKSEDDDEERLTAQDNSNVSNTDELKVELALKAYEFAKTVFDILGKYTLS